MRKYLLILIILVDFTFSVQSQSVRKAFQSLQVYNYYTALQIFMKNMDKKPIESCYGLTVIYSGTNNPYFDIDLAFSSCKKLRRLWDSADVKTRLASAKYGIDETTIKILKQRIDSINII